MDYVWLSNLKLGRGGGVATFAGWLGGFGDPHLCGLFKWVDIDRPIGAPGRSNCANSSEGLNPSFYGATFV